MKVMKKYNGHLIGNVEDGSIAQELNIEKGDYLLKINDQELEDVFDYQYLVQDDHLDVLIRKADGEEWLLDIDKDFDEDLGIEFEITVSFASSIRCPRELEIHFILRMMIQDFPSYRGIM